MERTVHALRERVSWLTVLMLALVAAFSCTVCEGAYAADASASAGLMVADGLLGQRVDTQAKNGWTADGNCYYRNGKRVTGLQEIDGRRFYFNSAGVVIRRDFELAGATYYVRVDGSLMGVKMNGQYYYDNLKRMTSADAYDFDTLIWARSIIDGITSENDSPEDKLWAAFAWVVDKGYAIHQNFDPNEENWPATYARYHFADEGGDCHSDGAAFAYLAAAIGFPADVCIDSWGTGYAPSHCWAMIGDAVYDPLFYESKSSMYYGATDGTYEVYPTARFRVPIYNSANASESEKPSSAIAKTGYLGLVNIRGKYYYFKNGKKLTGAWKTVNGKRYYFKQTGVAATGSKRIGGTYYVFNEKGELQSSKKGNHTVKIGGATYYVSGKGKAIVGWSPDKKHRYWKNGQLLTNVSVVGGKFFAASKKGVYNRKKTVALKLAGKRMRPAAVLYSLLGKPKAMHYSVNCEGKGYDGLWEYDGFIVTTIRPPDAPTVANTAYRLKKGAALPESYEYVWSYEKC